jgi:hypothetical protein
MIDIISYRPEHLAQIKLQHMQEILQNTDHANGLTESTMAWTAKRGDEVVCIAGVAEIWTNRGMAWVLLSETAGRDLLAITRALKRYLSLNEYKRLEAVVSCQWPEAQRWARMLGFREEVERAEAYNPDGTDAAIYVRIADG